MINMHTKFDAHQQLA